MKYFTSLRSYSNGSVPSNRGRIGYLHLSKKLLTVLQKTRVFSFLEEMGTFATLVLVSLAV